MTSCSIHLRAISLEMLQISITKIYMKIMWNFGHILQAPMSEIRPKNNTAHPLKLINWKFCWQMYDYIFIPPPNEVGGGVYWNHLVRLSVCPSVCRRHVFRSVTQVCFGNSISNFICMLLMAMGRSLLIFSDATFKMAAWRPSWIFRFPDS